MLFMEYCFGFVNYNDSTQHYPQAADDCPPGLPSLTAHVILKHRVRIYILLGVIAMYG
jgi:hypothetical protein